jgi:hypothetical protein
MGLSNSKLRVLCTGLLSLAFLVSASASAVSIRFSVLDLPDTSPGDDLFRYDYTLTDFAYAAGFGFSVLFDPGLYAFLESPPPAVTDWDILSLQPDPALPDEGLYDALAQVDGPVVLSGFSVEFVWRGPGSPGAQPFVVYDPAFGTVESGNTLPIPEPGTLALLASGLAALRAGRRRAGRPRSVAGTERSRRAVRAACPWLLLAGALPLLGAEGCPSSVAPGSLSFQSLSKEGEARVSRTEFRFDYRVEVANGGASAVTGVEVTVTSSSPVTQVTDGAASLGFAPAGGAGVTTDTISIVQDRTVPFDPAVLSFSFACPAGAADRLEVLPTRVRTRSIGSSSALAAHFETGCGRSDVTADPGTSYTSDAPGVVTVSAAGVLTFESPGSALVTVTHGGVSRQVEVEVDSDALELAEGPIGPAGGSVHLPDTTGLEIPPGALDAATLLAVAEVPEPPGAVVPSDGEPVGGVFRFTPDGQTFRQPVTLAIHYDPGAIPGGFAPEDLLVHVLGEDGTFYIDSLTNGPLGEAALVETVGQSVELASQRVSVQTDHFSDRALIARPPLGLTMPTTLTAPDGATLPVFRFLKTQKPGPAGGPAFVPVPTRAAGGIQHIVLHSTGNASNAVRFSGEVLNAQQPANRAWAHYYVGKDGTIVQISADTDVANHTRSNAALGITNDNAIGIEIFNNSPNQNYPGRQVSAIVRLVDFLMRANPGIDRPSNADPEGNLITHARVDPARRTDPENQFRTAVMGSPSLEEIVYRALRDSAASGAAEHAGIVITKGGDALGAGTAPGNAGDVAFLAGLSALENDFADSRTTLQVGPGTTVFSGSTDRMHILVDGTPASPAVLRLGADTTIDLDGILYVGPNGVLDARGAPDGGSGFDLEFTSDGFALVEGEVLMNGADKLGTEVAPFPSGSGSGAGGNGGSLTFRTAAPGPLWIPTIIARGGDSDDALAAAPAAAGFGGAVRIAADSNAVDDPIRIYFEGSERSRTLQDAGFALDHLPPPAPFNQMPVVQPLGSGIATGLCPAPLTSSTYIRPVATERLALGRQIDTTTHAFGAEIGLFRRGILTVGGLGAKGVSGMAGLAGGPAGDISISNETTGGLQFRSLYQLYAGAGAEEMGFVIFVVGGGCGDFKFFRAATGGLGGFGGLNGGPGGPGGAGGNISLSAAGFHPGTASGTTIFGYDGDNPNFTLGTAIGQVIAYDLGFETNSSGGSGGISGGSSSSFPGSAGPKGSAGTTVVNGTQVYP